MNQAHPLPAFRFLDEALPLSEELEAISAWTWELQQQLACRFEIRECLIGGAGAVAILDHVWFGEALRLRDLDIYVIRGAEVDEAFALAMAKWLEANQLGELEDGRVTPNLRANPALPEPESFRYLAGWGFNLLKAGRVMDVTIYHSAEQLPLNGLFDIDRIKLRLDEKTSLAGLARHHLRQRSYESLRDDALIQDALGGYPGWRQRQARLVNHYEVLKSPTLQAVRVVRTFGKLGCEALPPELGSWLREAMRRQPQFDSARLASNLRKVLTDPNAEAELRMLAEAGVPLALLSGDACQASLGSVTGHGARH